MCTPSDEVIQCAAFCAHIILNLSCFLWFFMAPFLYAEDAIDKQRYNLLAPPDYVLYVWWPLTVSFHYSNAGYAKLLSNSWYCAFLRGDDDIDSMCPGCLWSVVLKQVLAFLGTFYLGAYMVVGDRRLVLAPIALIVLWSGILYFYEELKTETQHSRRLPDFAQTVEDAVGWLSVHLTFIWLSGAVVFALIDMGQFFYGDYFSYSVYSKLMGVLLAFAVGVYAHTRDPFVPWMATWFLVGLATRKTSLEGEAKETFEMLQTALSL